MKHGRLNIDCCWSGGQTPTLYSTPTYTLAPARPSTEELTGRIGVFSSRAQDNKHFNHPHKVLLLDWYWSQNSHFLTVKTCRDWSCTRSTQKKTASHVYHLHFLSFPHSYRWRNGPVPCNKSFSGHGSLHMQNSSAFMHESLSFKRSVIRCMPFWHLCKTIHLLNWIFVSFGCQGCQLLHQQRSVSGYEEKWSLTFW